MAADDEITDLASGMFSDPTDPISDLPTRKTAAIRTAKGLVNCNVDWDGVEGAADPCLATVKLLHVARQLDHSPSHPERFNSAVLAGTARLMERAVAI